MMIVPYGAVRRLSDPDAVVTVAVVVVDPVVSWSDGKVRYVFITYPV